jgi:hypothetical protein
MSAETSASSTLFAKAWTLLSIVVSVVLFLMFAFGDHLLHAGGVVWSALRHLASPII